MIPGEYLIDDGEHELNAGRETVSVTVSNTGDRPVQVVAFVPVAGPVPPPSIVVMPEANASSICCGLMK